MTDQPLQMGDLAQLKSELLLAMAEMRGDTRLILQTLQQHDRRADQQDDRIKSLEAQLAAAERALDQRVDNIERDAVTRSQLEERSKKTIAILAVISTFVSMAVGAGITVIIAIVN